MTNSPNTLLQFFQSIVFGNLTNPAIRQHSSRANFALLFGWVIIVCLSAHTPNCAAGTYLNSAHGNSTTGVERPSMSTYAMGNCAHCHEQHASVGGIEPAPNDPAGPDVYLEAGDEEELCYACHGSGSGLAPDIETDTSPLDNYGHRVQDYTGIHRTNETLGNTTKHIECTDCHNPHAAGNTLHTSPGTAATLLTTTSPLYGVTGAAMNYETYAPNIWSAPDGGDYTSVNPATKEYQICFKCHSAAVGQDPATWSGTSASPAAGAWLDIGLEFNPYNKAGHPVVTSLSNYPNSIEIVRWPVYYKGLWNEADATPPSYTNWDQLLDPWGDNHNVQTMYCSDCHTTTSNGPHGSNIKWILKGANKAWPFTTAAANGDSTGTFRKIDTLFSWSPLFQQGLGTDDGCFCWNCHPADRNGSGAHQTGQHTSTKCVDCHVRIPHGSKVSRFIAAVNQDTLTGGTSEMPARYTADGRGNNSNGTATPIVRKFTKAVNWSYGAANCYVPSCNYHNDSNNGTESW